MSLSTPLDSLSSGPSAGAPPADEERVRRILAEMNAEAVVQPPPALASSDNRVITEPPISMSTGQIRMDSGTARANVIGNSTPTMADFHSMFQQASPGLVPFQPYRAPSADELHIPHPPVKAPSWKNIASSYMRGPIAVAIIVFLLNLPVVTSILSRYASWMYLSSGEISVGGILVKALLAAALFAAYQGVSSFSLDK